MQSFLKHWYSVGVLVRNNRIFRNYRFLKESESWSIQKLEEYQLIKLRELLYFSVNASEYYADKYKNFMPEIGKLECLEDLKKLPVLAKSDVLNNTHIIHSKGIREKLFFSETSGSTGKPLIFYRNKDWDAWHNASVFRGYSWHGVSPWERNGYLWGYNLSPSKRRIVKIQDFLQNRFRVFSYNENEITLFLKRLENCVYLNGYSSMIYEIAKMANSKNIKLENLKLVKGTSEKIFEAYQKEAKLAFGRRIVSEYGSAEGGIIAFECKYGKMHINMETVIVEEVENEIILTNLVSKSFPIIRYKLGDYIRINKNHNCECGMKHHVIEEVTGRVGDVIYGKKQKYPSLTLYYVFKNLALNEKLLCNYSALQEKAGRLVVFVEKYLSDNESKLIHLEFSKYFKEDIVIELYDGIKREDYSGKKRDFVSKVKL